MNTPSRIEIAVNRLIDLSLAHFDGHFDEFHVYPAVGQIEFVKEALAEHLGRRVQILSVQRSKFLSFIRPGDHIEIAVVSDVYEGPKVAQWIIQRTGSIPDDVISKGQLSYDWL